MWMSSCCTTLLLSARRAFGASISAQANAAGRLQSALDGVDPGGAPRVQVTFPTELAGAKGGELASLMVLDSSFNPPTRAHLHLLASSMERFGTARALLLLAKQNADKAVVGASLVQRLQMMELIAAADESGRTCCGLTGHPLFVDKAAALRALCSAEARVFMLVGFDTWIRITDPKYYAEGQMYAVLSRLLSDVDVVVSPLPVRLLALAAPPPVPLSKTREWWGCWWRWWRWWLRPRRNSTPPSPFATPPQQHAALTLRRWRAATLLRPPTCPPSRWRSRRHKCSRSLLRSPRDISTS